MKPEDIIKTRRAMGTLPEAHPRRSDRVITGVRDIKVELVDHTKNPYKAIFDLVTSTWGSGDEWWNRWERTPIEGRIKVVVSALEGKTLQQCLEAPNFTFRIQGLSRSAYDQLARHRFTSIGSVGLRDNRWSDATLRIPSNLKKFENRIREWWIETKDIYDKILDEGQASWQSARSILPMGLCWRFTWTMNYRALKDLMAQRLSFHEQYDTVATAWLMREEVDKKFPLLASYLRPVCDHAKKCLYGDIYSLSTYFGALFKPCGRWPVKESYAFFPNEASADPEEIQEQLGIWIVRPDEWDHRVKNDIIKDRHFFEE